MIFTITGTLPADNVDDAIAKLAEHFTALAAGQDPHVFGAPFAIQIRTVVRYPGPPNEEEDR